jgi:hypothetical protein
MQMRNLLLALVVVGLLAAPSFGLINVKLVADKTSLLNGESTVVHIWGQGTQSGLFALGGYINTTVVSGSADVLTTVAPMTFTAAFSPTMKPPVQYLPGTLGVTGGWGGVTDTVNPGFGTAQTAYGFPLDPNLGLAGYVEVCRYTVKADAVPAAGVVRLEFVGKSIAGFKPVETVPTQTALGTLTWVDITVTPEPITMALLAIGGLIVARRRR